jgi:cytochrome bd-type quinol oxidase subunit 2
MTKMQVSTEDRPTAAQRAIPPGTPVVIRSEKSGRRHLSPFWRHFLQMLAAMGVGMIATGAIFLTIVGAKTWDEVITQYPTQALLAMAVGMTVPMVAWMVYRGMGWKNSYEMAAVMVLPVIPLLCLVWFDVTKSAQCGAYCLLTVAAMLGLMLYRRAEYSTEMARR